MPPLNWAVRRHSHMSSFVRPELAPVTAFFQETAAFISTQTFILHAERLVRKDPSSALSKRREELNLAIPESYGGWVPYIQARLFIAYVAAFEVFLQDTVLLVVMKHPKKVGATTFALSDVLDAKDDQELVQRAAEELLYKLMYKKPFDYLKGVCEVLSIDPDPLKDNWKTFVEAKARRDLGVHSAWKCNDTYRRKLRDVGLNTSARNGESMLPPQSDEEYLDPMTDALLQLTQDITKQVASVHWPDVDPNAVELRRDA